MVPVTSLWTTSRSWIDSVLRIARVCNVLYCYNLVTLDLHLLPPFCLLSLCSNVMEAVVFSPDPEATTSPPTEIFILRKYTAEKHMYICLYAS